MYDLPEEHHQKIRNELKPGEMVAWAGQPDARQYARLSWVGTLFFIPWTAFALFWMAGASGFQWPDFSEGGFAFFPLFGLPFVFVGFWGLGMPWRTRRKAKSTVYVVTNQRVMVIEGEKSISYRSYYPNQIGNLEKVINPDSSGNLFFSRESYTDNDGDAASRKCGFIGIQDVNLVEDKIKKLLEKAA